MPNLQPDLSMYPKAGSGNMSLGDLLSIATHAQEYTGRQGISDALKSATDPATGEVDADKARAGFKGIQGWVGSDDYTHAVQLQQAQIAANQVRQNTVAGYIGQLVALGADATPKDVARMKVLAARVAGPQGAVIWDKTMDDLGEPGSPEFIKNAQMLKNSTGAAQEYKTQQTPQGPVSIPAERANILAAQGGLHTEAGNEAEWQHQSSLMSNYKLRVQPLEQMITLLKKLPEGSTYPGADVVNNLKTFLIAHLPENEATKVGALNAENAKDYAELRKYMTQYTQRQAVHGTDAGMYEMIASSPNTKLPQAANRDLSKVLLGGERLEQVTRREFARTNMAGSQYPTFADNFQKKLDPRAFVFDMATPEQQAKVLKTLPKDGTPQQQMERKKFLWSLELARKHEVQSPPGGWGTE